MPVIIIFLVSFSFFSCAREKGTVDPSFEPFVARFQQEANKQGVGEGVQKELPFITIKFDDNARMAQSGAVGYCQVDGDEKTIGISKEYWSSKYIKLSDQEAVVFHELGHCVLGRPHTQDEVKVIDVTFIDYRLPSSVMYPDILGAYVYEINYPAYIRELFRGQKPKELYFYSPSVFPAEAYSGNSSSLAISRHDVTESPEAYAFKSRFILD